MASPASPASPASCARSFNGGSIFPQAGKMRGGKKNDNGSVKKQKKCTWLKWSDAGDAIQLVFLLILSIQATPSLESTVSVCRPIRLLFSWFPFEFSNIFIFWNMNFVEEINSYRLMPSLIWLRLNWSGFWWLEIVRVSCGSFIESAVSSGPFFIISFQVFK